MLTNLRQSGVHVLGDVPSGTHFCHFYRTREDLLDVLVPYFKAGLQNNEFCLWVTSEPLSVEQAVQALTESVPDFSSCLSRGQIEIVPQDQWYPGDREFDLQKVLDAWVERLNEALARGYDGMRISSEAVWLNRDWKRFADYEASVNSVLSDLRMIALCTYSLERCNTNAVFDVLRNHGAALIRNEGRLDVVTTSAETKTRQALVEKQERLHAVLNASTEMMALLDPDGTVLEMNEACSRTMGVEREMVLGRNLWDFLPPDIALRRKALVDKVLQTGRPLRSEDEGQNGRWYGHSLYPLQNARGDVTRVAVYSRDVTEAKRADDAVRESEERYRRLLEGTSDGICVLDREWRFLLTNQANTYLVQMPQERLLGNKLTDLFPGIEETEFFRVYQRVMESRVGEKVVGEFVFPDGRTGWYEVNVDPVPEGILCIARDITERRRAEENLILENGRREVLLGLQGLMDADDSEIYDYVVEGSLRSTRSDFSFITVMDETESVMTIHSWSKGAMKQCSMRDKPIYYPVADAGIWADCIRQRRPVVVNDYEAGSPGKKGYPTGHVPIKRFMSVPVFDAGRIAAVAAVANKRTDYDESDVDALNVLTYRMWNTISRKRAVDETRTGLERYRGLYEAVAGGVVLQGRDGAITEANAMARDILGLTTDEITGRTSADPRWHAIHEDGSGFPGEEHPSIVTLRTGKPLRNVVMGIHNPARDERRWILINSEPIRDASSGEIEAAVTTFLDITDRRRMFEQLQLSEERYRLVVENAYEAVAVIRDGNIIFANSRSKDLLGYLPGEIISRSMLDFIHPDYHDVVLESYVRTLRGEDVPDFYELKLVDRWGQERWVELRGALTSWNGEGAVLIVFLNDITESKKAADALRASEERYRLVVENASEAILVVDGDRIIFANAKAEQISGYTREELASKSALEFLHSEDSEQAVDLLARRAISLDAGYSTTFRFLDKSGRTRWVNANSATLDSQGKKLALAFASDVTDRKKAEEDLRASEERYRLVVENAHEAILVVQDDRIVFANTRAKHIAGYTAEDLGSRAVLDFVHPDDRQMAGTLYHRRLIGEGAPVGLTFRFIDKWGNIRWGESSAALFDWQGKPAVAVFLNDVTERRRAEEAVRASEERYRLVVEYTYDAIVVIQDGRPVFANRKAEELSGYPREELALKPVTDFVHPGDLERVTSDYQEAMTGGAIVGVYEFRFVDRNGKTRLVQVNGVLFDWEGKPALLGFMSDVTQRRKAENALKASEEKYRRIVETANEGIVVTDREGRLTFSNSRAALVFGYSVAEMLGKSYIDFVPRKDRARYRAAWRRQMNGASDQYETCLARKDGSTMWTMVSVSPLFEDGGRYAGTLAMITDITRLKDAETRLRESQKHLRTISDSGLVGVTVCDLKGRIWEANDAFLGIIGYTREDLKKGRLDWREMTPKEYADANDRATAELLEKGFSGPFEKEYQRKDGGRVSVMVGGALVDVDGDASRFVCVALDITRVKMAEEALAKERNMLRAIMENTEAQLAYLDRDFRFLQVNSSYVSGSRHSARRLIGRNHFELFPDRENQAIFERVRDTGKGVRFHDRPFRFADQPERGVTFWDWSLHPVKDASGRVDGLVLSLVDTTERVRIQDELTKHREQLESLVELRTRKLSRSYDLLRKEIAERKKVEEQLRGLSNRLVQLQEEERKSLARELHDEIGQSLTMVKLFLDRYHSCLPDDTARKDSAEVSAVVKKLMEQVRSLSLDLRPTMLDDLGLVPALQWHFHHFTDQSHVQVNFRQSGLENRRIPGEVGTAAYRIVQEALTNVARYANVAEAMVSIAAKKGLLRIEVEDHGSGFDVEKAAEGSGAGLSGIRERVIALKGTLTIESAEGAGTYILAELPLPDGAEKKGRRAAHR